MRQTTMKRIAGELGVSITTVSKVLNNHADIGEATRSRVLAKVEELGYQRNAVARSLTLRRTHTIGVIIPDLMRSFFVEIVAGVEPVASARGYGLLLCNSGDDPRKERAELAMLRGRQVDGVVLATANGAGNTDVLRQLPRQGTGLVMIDRDDHPSVKCHRVLTDDERVGTLATAHLLDAGRRAVAHIAGPPVAHARRRERGWRETMMARGLPPPDAWLAKAGFTQDDGNRAMTALLAVQPRVDAVFAASDSLAIGAMKAIWAAGRRVPDDIAVVGVGDIAFGDLLRVPLTTIGWSRAEQGRHAAALLLDGLDDEDPSPQRVIVPPRLIVRASSGATE
jgi:LacI family transcriptional regulator